MSDKKEKQEPEKREPLVSLSALMFFGGALIWAANQNWLEMAQFFEMITREWRDFLRKIWTEIFASLGFRIDLLPHQKDILSLNAILLGGALYRTLFGKKPQPLFYPAIGNVITDASEKAEKYKLRAATSFLLKLSFLVFTGALYFLVLYPFMDIYKFSHDLQFIYMFAITSNLVFGLSRFVMSGGMAKYFARYRENWKNALLRDFALVVALAIVLVGFILIIMILNWLGVSSFLSSVTKPITSKMDPHPFNIGEYLGGLMGETGVDLTLLSVSVLLLYLTAGKSLKPLAQFILVGATIVLAGWASKVALGM